MAEQKGLVTFKGNPSTLVGNEVKVGQKAPDFVIIDNNLSPVRFSSYLGKICIISSVVSLDTPVCDTQTRKFNEEASRLGPNVMILTISMDLPFAQKRWCGAAGVDRLQTLSDHRDASFGMAYGLLIKELLNLLAGHYGVIKEYMTAVYAGNKQGADAAREKLLKNGGEIAGFLSSANPNWPKESLLSALAAHAGHHMAQIEAINGKNWPSEAQTWEAMKNHIYTIADVLASGIVKQFPAKF